eukprot:756141-Hanusia_phi.AAC.1
MEQEQKRQKGLAIIPPMLVTPEERQAYIFRRSAPVRLNQSLVPDALHSPPSTNLMSVDSFSEEYNRAFINTWTDEEKQIFMEKLADFAGRPDKEGLKKNFYKLSHYLPNKTTRDCIKYYYLQKTSKSFKEAYKKLEVKYKRTYNLKSKLEKIPKGPVNNNQTSTYEGTRGNHEVFLRKFKNDKAEAVIHRGFEGLDDYSDLPADVVPIVIEKSKSHHARSQNHVETSSISS